MRAIRNGDPPGRFLRKDDKTGKWIDIGDKKAAEKTSQALREKTGDEKEEKASDTPFESPTLIVPTPAADKAAGKKMEGEEKKKDDSEGDAKKADADDDGAAKEPLDSVEV